MRPGMIIMKKRMTPSNQSRFIGNYRLLKEKWKTCYKYHQQQIYVVIHEALA